MVKIKVRCNICDGTGVEYDINPHNGSRAGEGYPCTYCEGQCTMVRLATDKERLAILEKMVGIPNLIDFEPLMRTK